MNWHKRFLQQARWTRDLRHYLFGRAGMRQAQRVLEVGCGTGAVLADISGSTIPFGLDIDAGRLKEAQGNAPQSRLVCADGLSLPFPAACFNITFCHYLLLWVSDPLEVLCEMKRVTQAGGSVLALAEPDHTARVDEPSALAALGRWQTEALRRQGADPSLGGRLADLFRQAGIYLVETGSLAGDGKQLAGMGEWELEWDVLEADLAGMIAPEEIIKLKQLDKRAWQRGERVLHVPTYFAHGVV